MMDIDASDQSFHGLEMSLTSPDHVEVKVEYDVKCKEEVPWDDEDEQSAAPAEVNAPFYCLVCGRAFGQRHNLIKHQRIHTGERPYCCQQCGKSFIQKQHLTKHQRLHTGERPYICLVCGRGFSLKHNLTTHKRIHTGEKPYPCTQCGKNFSRRENLRAHQRCHLSRAAGSNNLVQPKEALNPCGVVPQPPPVDRPAKEQSEPPKASCSGRPLNPRPFICPQCGKRFFNKQTFINHYRIHTGQRPHTCPECGRSFIQKQHLTKHIRTHTGEKPYTCSECGRSFSMKHNLCTHMKTHTGEKPYSCSACGKRFTRRSTYQAHQRIHCKSKAEDVPSGSPPGGSHPLEDGTSNGVYIVEVPEQITLPTAETPITCKHCGKRVGDCEENIACTYCGTSSNQRATPSEGLHHRPADMVASLVLLEKKPLLIIDSGESPNAPDPSDQMLGSSMVPQSHKEPHVEATHFSCQWCGQLFGQREDLEQHEPLHSGEKIHACGHCGKTFFQKNLLLKHEKMHIRDRPPSRKLPSKDLKPPAQHWSDPADKPFSCSTCRKTFSHQETLTLHQRSHQRCPSSGSTTGEQKDKQSSQSAPRHNEGQGRVFPCSVCGKSFNQKHTLINHLRIHSGERPYPCPTCGKSFIQKQHLTKHMRLHTGERPYSCQECGRSFSLKHNLTTHQRIHTGERPYACNQCGKRFNRRGILLSHERIHLQQTKS